jgi:hypothetical protein
MESYGVVWQEESGEPAAGKLEIDPSRLRFEGKDAARTIELGELAAVRVGREPGDRLDGRPTILLDLTKGGTIRVAALTQAGVLFEITERLAAADFQIRAAS